MIPIAPLLWHENALSYYSFTASYTSHRPLKLDPQFSQVICFHLILDLLNWDYNLTHAVLINCDLLRLSLPSWTVLKLSTSLNVSFLTDCPSDCHVFVLKFPSLPSSSILLHINVSSIYSLLSIFLLQCPCYYKLLTSIVLKPYQSYICLPLSQDHSTSSLCHHPPPTLPSKHIYFLSFWSTPSTIPSSHLTRGFWRISQYKTLFLSKNKNTWGRHLAPNPATRSRLAQEGEKEHCT